MGNLRDQLHKAKLLSKKDAKRLAHEERVERKTVGREGLEQRTQERRAEIEQKRDEERERDRDREKQAEADRQADAERAACLSILENEVREPLRGNVTWHFEVEGGYLPFFKTSDLERHQLQSGQLRIVRRGPRDAHAYGVLPAHLAERVEQQFPERVV